MYSVQVLADSLNLKGVRLTTIEVTYPRIIHAEMMTHRQFSRNFQSNRAIPANKLISDVMEHPFIPKFYGKNQKGMNPGEQFFLEEIGEFNRIWLLASKRAAKYAKMLVNKGVHKSIPNRLLEPFQSITGIISATQWTNFFNLRIDKDAEPHMRYVATMIYGEYVKSQPIGLAPGEWHLPLIFDSDRIDVYNMLVGVGKYTYELYNKTLAKISVGRCARVSYLTHHGVRDLAEDIRLYDDLLTNGHWSPFEHQAMSMDNKNKYGNYVGWRQFRKMFDNEVRNHFDIAKIRV